MVDAARLADELRSEQDHTTTLTQGKRALETQLGELENRLADANDAAMRGGKSAMARPALERTPRLTREPSARSRSSSSRTMRTERTRTACPTWPPSSRARSRPTRSRSRRPRRSLPSTWPSSARPSRSLRRPRTELGWLRTPCTPLSRQHYRVQRAQQRPDQTEQSQSTYKLCFDCNLQRY